MNPIDLPHDQRLHLEEDGRLLRLEGADGRTGIRIRITREGPVLEVDGDLALRAGGRLELEGESVAIRARDHLQLSAGGDADVAIKGDLMTRARINQIRAELGDVRISANDDVRLDGERIFMNS